MSARNLADALVLGLHRRFLALAPREFRARFGVELLDCAERALDDAHGERGALASFLGGLRSAADVATNALALRCETQNMKTTLLVLPLALLVSFFTAYIDANQSEVQPAVGLLMLGGALFAYFDSRRAWLWWLVLGSSIPCARVWMDLHGQGGDQGPFMATFLAFLPAGFGTLLGSALRVLRGRKPSGGAPA
ncbi:MAG: hypothetical protein EXS08_13290 [Planctomycetes bacterium]|nr:hypothetical protein [Planctomycetota bacterium]